MEEADPCHWTIPSVRTDADYTLYNVLLPFHSKLLCVLSWEKDSPCKVILLKLIYFPNLFSSNSSNNSACVCLWGIQASKQSHTQTEHFLLLSEEFCRQQSKTETEMLTSGRDFTACHLGIKDHLSRSWWTHKLSRWTAEGALTSRGLVKADIKTSIKEIALISLR